MTILTYEVKRGSVGRVGEGVPDRYVVIGGLGHNDIRLSEVAHQFLLDIESRLGVKYQRMFQRCGERSTFEDIEGPVTTSLYIQERLRISTRWHSH